MDWANESYVKVYVRETDDDLALSWEARALWDALIKRLDRSGVVATKRGAKGLAAVVRIPAQVVERALPELLTDGRLREIDGGYIAPNYIAAQEARKSDKLRQKEVRDRRRIDSMTVTKRDAGVTSRDETVTGGHTESLSALLCSADPLLREESRADAAKPDPLPSKPAAEAGDPDPERIRRQEIRREIWREIETARAAVATELGITYRPLPMFDHERELVALFVQVRDPDLAAEHARHAIAVAREEATTKRSLEWFSGVIFGDRQIRRSSGMDPAKMRAARIAAASPSTHGRPIRVKAPSDFADDEAPPFAAGGKP